MKVSEVKLLARITSLLAADHTASSGPPTAMVMTSPDVLLSAQQRMRMRETLTTIGCHACRGPECIVWQPIFPAVPSPPTAVVLHQCIALYMHINWLELLVTINIGIITEETATHPVAVALHCAHHGTHHPVSWIQDPFQEPPG